MEREAVPSLSVVFLRSAGRDEALAELINSLEVPPGVERETLLTAVRARELSLSSRVSDTVAIPHAIRDELQRTLVVAGVSPSGIEWDGREERVRVVILLVGPSSSHLSVLSAIARRLQSSGTLEAIVEADDPETVKALLLGETSAAAQLGRQVLAVTEATVQHAAELARIMPRTPVVIAAPQEGLLPLLGPLARPPLAGRTFLVGPERPRGDEAGITVVQIDRLPSESRAMTALTLLPLLATGVLNARSAVILVSGHAEQGGLDAVRVVHVSRELQVPEGLGDSHLPDGVRMEVVVKALGIAAELGSEGREGKPVGTIFVIGDDPALDRATQQMILNPFAGYAPADRNILDPSLAETVKEIAKIDGAFLISGDGTIRSAGTHLAGMPDPEEMTAGQGARHAAALGITSISDVLSICLSESTGAISVFRRGRRVIRR